MKPSPDVPPKDCPEWREVIWLGVFDASWEHTCWLKYMSFDQDAKSLFQDPSGIKVRPQAGIQAVEDVWGSSWLWESIVYVFKRFTESLRVIGYKSEGDVKKGDVQNLFGVPVCMQVLVL